ncbi:MAG: DUF4159 domain-containing protein [Acidobacteriota bacterium]
MKLPVAGALAALLIAGSLAAFETPWREYPALEHNNFPVPTDYNKVTDFVFARLMFPATAYARFDRAGPRWAEGMSTWTQDYPAADRHFMLALNRLTLVNARSVEQPVNLDVGDDVYNYPFLYAVRPGEWQLTDTQAAKMRDYINRGGFFMCDDFWGTSEWDVFMQSFGRVFPDAEVVDIPNQDAYFHLMFDLDERYRIPGAWGLRGPGYQNDGSVPYWRAIYQPTPNGGSRMVALMIPNSDLGDSWEYADQPQYPEMYSRLGLRLGINAVVYAMTH